MNIMGYDTAMKAAGAKILASDIFGLYQRVWIAFIEYNGERGIVQGDYGSGSQCDAFSSEIGDYSHYHDHGGYYYNPVFDPGEFVEECETCQALIKRFVAFGKSYCESMLPYEQVLINAKKNAELDSNAPEIISFIERNRGLLD